MKEPMLGLNPHGVTVHYVERGRGLPVVLLHGFPLDGRIWDAQLAALSDRFRVIVPDLPGFGRSSVDQPFTIESLADDEVVIIPDRHGIGTNALLLTPAGVISPSFGDGSCERHQQIAKKAGASARVETNFGIGLDVDTADDLDTLSAALEQADRSVAPFTRSVIGRLGPR